MIICGCIRRSRFFVPNRDQNLDLVSRLHEFRIFYSSLKSRARAANSKRRFVSYFFFHLRAMH